LPPRSRRRRAWRTLSPSPTSTWGRGAQGFKRWPKAEKYRDFRRMTIARESKSMPRSPAPPITCSPPLRSIAYRRGSTSMPKSLPDSPGGAPAHPGRRETQGRDPDGQPGLLARRHSRSVRDSLVGGKRRSARGVRMARRAGLDSGYAEDSPADSSSGLTRLGLWPGAAPFSPYTAGDAEYRAYAPR
jgi:hypothetical protein